MIHQERISFDGGQSWQLGASISSVESTHRFCVPLGPLVFISYYLQYLEEKHDERAEWRDRAVRILRVEPVLHPAAPSSLPGQLETQVRINQYTYVDYSLAGGPNTSVIDTGPGYEFQTDGGDFVFSERVHALWQALGSPCEVLVGVRSTRRPR